MRVIGRVRARTAHLRQYREISFLQHQADVGMGDQMPLIIQYVGIAAGAHFHA